MNRQINSSKTSSLGHFDFSVIDGFHQLQDSYLLRYQVYCQQMGFLTSDAYTSDTSELETDQYDQHSIHIGGVDKEGGLVDSVRLVQSSNLGFPLQEHCVLFDEHKKLFDKTDDELSHYAEISRLVVSPNTISGLTR